MVQRDKTDTIHAMRWLWLMLLAQVSSLAVANEADWLRVGSEPWAAGGKR